VLVRAERLGFACSPSPLNGPGARQDLARQRPPQQSPGTKPTVGAGLSR